MIDEVANIEAGERQIDLLIERRARGNKGAQAANAEDAFWRARDARRNHTARLENARGWIEHFGALALVHHDLAARAAQKCDQARELARQLESNERKSA